MRIRIAAPIAACGLATVPLTAQPTPPPPAEEPAADPAPDDARPETKPEAAPDQGYEEVIVTAEAGDRRLIDRRSYLIKDSPAAETKTATEVLRDLPSVSVDGNGRLRLLNNGNVRILIDGRTVPDPQGFLRNLTGNEIARVEVMTNPSAQFAADGTAGVINVILRKTYRPGIAGTASGSIDTLGSVSASLSPSFTDGPWTLSASPRLSIGRYRASDLLEQVALQPDALGIANRTEATDTTGRDTAFSARTQLGYKLNERRSLTGSFSLFALDSEGVLRTDVSPRAGGFAPFRQINDRHSTFNNISGALEYRADGKLPNQSLTMSTTINRSLFGLDSDYIDSRSAGGAAFTRNAGRFRTETVESKLDYTTPRGKSDRLSVGGRFEVFRNRAADESSGTPLIGPSRNVSVRYGGDYVEGSAYATYQTGFGKLKVLPGLRVQSRHYGLDGTDADGPGRTDLFPSLHLEHPVVKAVDLNLSYSRRVDWPEIARLSPVLRLGGFTGPTSAAIGNPALDPAFTDAVEAKLAYAGKRHNATVTLFDRTTHGVVEGVTTLRPDGVLLASFRNVGTRIERGAEAAAQGRLLPRLRYSISGNIAAVERQVIDAGRRATDSQYGGKVQLSYAEPRAAAPGYDQVEAIIEYVGPFRSFQSESEGFITTNLNWTHRLTPRLSSVLNVQDPLGARVARYTTRLPDLLVSNRSTSPAPVVRLSLTRSLGKPAAQPPRGPAAD